MKNASLTIVGTGIKFLSHLTIEAKIHIEQSDKVLYLVNEPAMKEWIQKSNPNTESLDDIYIKYPLRLHCYREITNYILETIRKDLHVCVVLYGHPSVFAQPALHAAVKARKEGYLTKILPGISAEDCLFADLFIDPGSQGCQSYEATDLLIRRRQIDSSCHLILWQVGIIGALGYSGCHDNQHGAKVLRSYLNQHYNLEHRVILYEAAQYPHFKPRMDEIALDELPSAKFSPISTLYVPPSCKSNFDEAMLKELSINMTDLQ